MEANTSNMLISLDKLPIKRLAAIEENGIEHYPPSEISQDDKRLALLQRIDFTPAVEKEAKKSKTSKESSTQTTTAQQWPWQSLVENLQQAHQELQVIIDLINTVETNDAVTVAMMTRPKQLPNEVMSDLAISASTKLQCFRHLGRYLKQSAKALEHQVAREARFYGALIRLQQNWKVKRQRLTVAAPGSEGFTIDLSDNTLLDPTFVPRPPSISTVRIDHDPAGMLAIHVPPKSCRSIHLEFLDGHSTFKPRKISNNKAYWSDKHTSGAKKEASDEDVDKCIRETHSVLREIHRAIFDEQMFDLVNREVIYPKLGINVIGLRENFLQLGIGQEVSISIRLLPSTTLDDQTTDKDQTQNGGIGLLPPHAFEGMGVANEKHDNVKRSHPRLPNPLSFEIYLQQILHENVFLKGREKRPPATRAQGPIQPSGDGFGLLSHFCMTLAHRIFSYKVLAELENLVARVPYLHLLSHPTWHSRTSSWSLTAKVPLSILHGGHDSKNRIRSQFHTKVVVNDECISIGGEGAPNVVGLFRGNSMDVCSVNCYDCDLADLSVVLLQQVASQVVHWLHEEALIVGMKVSRDFLGLSFELEQGDNLRLVARVDPEGVHGCITWWLLLEDGLMEEMQLHTDLNGTQENKRFLGHLSLEALYSTLMDLVSLCNSSGNS